MKIMTNSGKHYPDLSDIYVRKEQARREAAKLSFGEKIAMIEALRERVAPLKALRESRKSSGKAPQKALRSND